MFEAPSLDPELSGCGLSIATAHGCWLSDVDGKRYFDGSGGSGAVNLGHGHPGVIRACHSQLDRALHLGWNIACDRRREFGARLSRFLPIPDARLLFCVTGAEAVEATLKVAHAATGGTWNVAFQNSYHGKISGALSVTWREDFRRHAIFGSPTLFAEIPDVGRNDDRIADLEEAIAVHSKQRGPPAAIVVEPVQCAEGVYEAKVSFLKALRRLADALGALLVFDEIYTGFGRLGRRFVAGPDSVLPDLLVVGKALGNGVPIAAVAGSEEVMATLPHGAHTSTFSAHPLGCAAGLAVLDVMEEGWVPGEAATNGLRLRRFLDGLTEEFAWIGPVRGTGLMLAFDCLTPGGHPAPACSKAFLHQAFVEGIVLRGGGRTGATIKLTPPLLIDEEAFEFLETALRNVAIRIDRSN